MQHIIRREAITTARRGTRVPLARLCREIAEATAAPAVDGTDRDADALVDDDLLSRLLLGQLQSVGLFSDTAPRLPLGEELRRWLDESVRQLLNRGYLHGAAAHPRPVHAVSSRDVWAEWEERSAQWSRNADLRAQVLLLDAMLRALPRILTGEVLATDVMFPNSSMELVEGIYKNNPVTDTFNGVMADAVAGIAQEILRGDPSARIRILEIGAGTGGGSVKVFEKLEPLAAHVETYCYTDLSKSFLMYAEKEYGPAHPYLDYRIFNVEEPLAGQDVEPGSYDIVLATNVLHATKDIRRTLRNAKGALKENGVLLANELSSQSLFTHLTFGLLEGWWLYEDTELRIPGCPGLSPESWEEVLDEEGFGAVSFPAQRLHDLGHQVIAADSDGMIRQELADAPAAGGTAPAQAAGAQEPPARPEAPGHRPARAGARTPAVTDEVLEQHVKDVIFDQLKLSLKVDRTQIAADDAFMDYGIDSIIGVQLIQEINRRIGTDLATTDLFDHGSVNRLARYIAGAHRAEATASLPAGLSAQAAEPAPPVAQAAPHRAAAPQAPQAAPRAPHEPAGVLRKEPIAIVGMSGRFGGSPGVEQLWEHLSQGHDLTEKISRWDMSGYHPEGAQGCDRGSFIDDIDRFDPTFFNISGIEATYMDPQQRVFLEESWKALEDAGYAGSGTQGRQVGVYVGCQESGYAQLFGGEAPPQSMWGNALSAMPARISYHLDLQGPAISVDTACSSSLVAIHLACQGLWGGETEMAVAGGVAIQTTPKFWVIAGQAGMLSPSGRCHTFDERADGFVPGEGAAVVVLKRLSDALADGDHIHGVISGSGINQDGASNGITAPSAKSQERLETSVYDAFGINPEHIQLMEAHGTGTKLGDPIEYHALKRAFRRYTQQRDYCALGSIKSNLGHTITAAGVAGVIKVLLSLRHRRIPPSINFERGNAHIDFTDSPFYVNTEDRPWEAGGDGTRRAAVSSFGVSGTNAHLVIEEAPYRAHRTGGPSAHLVTLSAGTAEQLAEQAERLLAHCERQPGLDPGDIGFTLLVGRKHLPHRLACVVRDRDELVQSLRLWAAKGQSPRVCAGEVPAQGHQERAALRNFGNQCIRQAAAGTDPDSLAELLATVADLYVQGYGLDYAALFADGQYSRVPLPTYPFARDRYWVPQAPAQGPALPAAAGASTAAHADRHPLLHADVSDFRSRRYLSEFTGEEFFLRDHVVKGQKVLPGVACLEMARAAAALTLGGTVQAGPGLALRNVVWARPVTAGADRVTLTTALVPRSHDEADYEISGTAGGAPVVHSQGQVVRKEIAPAVLDLPGIRAACDRTVVEASRLYPAYEAIGFRYGDAHRGIERLHIGRDQVLVRLTLPTSVRDTRDDYVLHPALLDATLQASLGMGLAAGDAGTLDVSGMKPSLPFALDELEVLGSCTDAMWAWIRYSAGVERGGKVFKLDIDLCDEQGGVRARIRGMSYRVLDGEVGAAAETPASAAAEVSSVTFVPAWQEAAPGGAAVEPARHVVLLPDLPALADALSAQDPAVRVLPLTSTATGIAERFTDHTEQALAHVRALLRDRAQEQVLVQLVVPDREDLATVRGLLGLLKSAQAEDPRLLAQAVLVDPAEPAGQLAARVAAGRRHAGEACLRFRDGRTEALTWVEGDDRPEVRVPWRAGGVYLVTGGLGGVGTLFAQDMATGVPDLTLVLAGRSPLRPAQEALLDGWRAQGVDVRHERVDVARPAEVRALVDGILREHGALHGIIHSAGVLRDGLIGRKTAEECREVLAPKVAGLVNLDEASKDVPLDFLAVCAGAAGVFGNAGQADYAAANAFQDAYTHHRRELVARGERFGASVCVDWPLWADGGMRVDSATETVMRERLGMVPMPTAVGLAALYAALDAPRTQVLVVAGDAGKIRETVLHRAPRPEPASVRPAPALPAGSPSGQALPARAAGAVGADRKAVRPALVTYLRNTLAEVIQVPAHRIDPGAPFERFGIDSVLALTVTNRLEADFGSLSKTLFFEYRSIDDLSGYFLGAHAGALESVLGLRAPAPEPAAPVLSAAPVLAAAPLLAVAPLAPVAPVAPAQVASQRRPEPPEDAIAVVGLAGRYPGAKDLDELWENLLAGRDCVTEVPEDRWDHSLYYDPEQSRPDRTATKWGGFIDGVADFDPLFFHVSPREAAIMDPQTRLFLECVWNLLEGTGYTRDRLRTAYGSRVGVYVGAMYQQYQLLSSDIVHESITSVMSYSAVANRVSHFFDLQGPSLAVDTTCSSSLVAIHMACEELRRGTCELMIAGGVNLTLHPKKFLGLSLTGLTGSGPDSRAFLDGDGFLPAEGVGAVLLKPLSRAVADGDEILAVIRSSATNHKGRTNGPMVPSPDRQAELIEENLERAGIHPRTVGHVEASANGSQLGDAIEFAALRKVFGRHTRDEGFCALGTVKSTFGNAEAASGIAQLSKVALQLKHRKLLPFVGEGRLNPGVEPAGTAFFLPPAVQPWHRPVVDLDGQEREYPRRATISAFGAGGSNAHLVVEEYVPEQIVAGGYQDDADGYQEDRAPQVVVLSARNEDRLKAVAGRLLEFVGAQPELSLADLAHTLQSGREAMDARLALVAGSVPELVEGLGHYLGGAAGQAPVPLFTGDARRDDSDLGALLSGRVGDAVVRELLAENRPENVALFWARGGSVPWEAVPREGRAPRMLRTLPTYPFDRKRHWVTPGRPPAPVAPAPAPSARAPLSATGVAAPAGTGAGERITALVADLLGVPADALDPDAPLQDLGFSSILAMQLVKALQTEVDPAADLQALDGRSTRDLVRRFGSATPPRTAAAPAEARFPEVIRLNARTEGRPVFWFHGGLGGLEVYGAIADSFGRPFHGIQARGWMSDADPLSGITAMAAHYAHIIRTVQPEGPYDLGGYSLGGLLAYEVTRQLQEQGETVESIVMVDAMYGDRIKEMTMSRSDMVLQQVNALLFAAVRLSPERLAEAFITAAEVDWSQDDDQLLDGLIAVAQQRGLGGSAQALRALVEQNVKVQEAYGVLEYDIRPLARPESVTCFYFRNRSGLFYGELAAVFSTQEDGTALDQVNYWEEWQRQLPNFHQTDVDSSNHFAVLSDPKSLAAVRSFCELFYSGDREEKRISAAKSWVGRRRRAARGRK
ncbi:SDR family NAD(P)-dependent oxidoreductase [Kitasatospora sp. NBC_00240]|uniref:SDR family NAD(P)-dependent oxidoreductase n=1 Tax=Kitasatospora sp. NBC_00240 TaxID=2903567 RepID=UPI002251B97C|nr:SDR family NAD(P)-dependent oxidoreductase [Kitasatospora sp. NBC_00240]MCX5214357.1 SDR family NAD(P)-dependent oxidoreductase [Kitasatospora sp. NBC_00240]